MKVVEFDFAKVRYQCHEPNNLKNIKYIVNQIGCHHPMMLK